MTDPERDRRLAQQVRHGWRNAEPLANAIDGFLTSEAMRNARRFRKVVGALAEALGPTRRPLVTPIAVKSGVLTLAVKDSVALAELRQHFERELLTVLAAHGTGVSRIMWRCARR